MRNAVAVSLSVLAACCAGCSTSDASSSTPVSEYISNQVQTRSTAEHISDGGTYVAYGQNIVLDTAEPITLILHDSSLESISGGHDVTLALTGSSEVASIAVGGTVSVVGSGSLTVTDELTAERALVNSGELTTEEHTEVGCDIFRFGERNTATPNSEPERDPGNASGGAPENNSGGAPENNSGGAPENAPAPGADSLGTNGGAANLEVDMKTAAAGNVQLGAAA